jgi:hypothetical protein
MSVCAPLAAFNPRAITATPDELRTSPGVALTILMDAGVRAMRPAISNAEIGPAASSS